MSAADSIERKGFRFLHKTWRRSEFSAAQMKSLPHEQTAQEFIVTRVASRLVYYRAVHRDGERESLGIRFVCNAGELAQYVLCEAKP